jgi:hypothetical protein
LIGYDIWKAKELRREVSRAPTSSKKEEETKQQPANWQTGNRQEEAVIICNLVRLVPLAITKYCV